MKHLKYLLAGTVLAAASAVAYAQSQTPKETFDEGQVKAIEGVVKDYLLKNPEILIEMQQAFEAKAETARAESLKAKLPRFYKELEGMKAELANFTVGDGEVAIIEFFDYNCGYCRRALPDIVNLMEKDKGVRTVFIEYPVLGPNSLAVSHIAVAAAKQGKYFEFHRGVMEGGPATEAGALKVAEKLGLDMTKLKADMAAPETEAFIAALSRLGRELFIDGTPSFIVGDKFFPGAAEPEQLQELVAEVRSSGCKACVKDEKKS